MRVNGQVGDGVIGTLVLIKKIQTTKGNLIVKKKLN